jgi:hypothetical protein
MENQLQLQKFITANQKREFLYLSSDWLIFKKQEQ